MTREETIKWLESLKAEIGKSEHRTLWHYAEAIDMAIEALSERPKGEWIEPQLIYTDAHKVTCTNCGGRVVIVGETNYCPNCGADMRGDTE